MVKRLLGCVLVGLFAFGCQSSGSGTAPTSDSGGGGGFGPEGDLPERGSMTGGAETSLGELRAVYFDYDDYGLKPRAKQDLQHNAGLLGKRSDARLEIQGNCDNRGTEEYNLALGKRRAEAARRYLIDLGVKSARITTISFGEENPVVRGTNEAAWAKNRRDDFVLR